MAIAPLPVAGEAEEGPSVDSLLPESTSLCTEF